MDTQGFFLALFVAIVAGAVSILALVRPEIFTNLIERWVNFLIKKAPAKYGSQEKTFQGSGRTRKTFALSIIRIGGFIGLVETLLLLFMLWNATFGEK